MNTTDSWTTHMINIAEEANSAIQSVDHMQAGAQERLQTAREISRQAMMQLPEIGF